MSSENLTPDEADAFVALVRTTARNVVLPRFRNLSDADIATKDDATDLVTVADRDAEAALSAGARHILPGCAVVGEEAVAEEPGLLDLIGDAGTCVIIDPVDGTFNFARGLAVFGMILAVTRNGRAVFGLLYDPVMDDWVVAHRGGGAFYRNAHGADRRLAVRDCPSLNLAEGTVPLDLAKGAERARILDTVRRAENARSLRCSCHEYRMLAMGMADFSINMTSKPWDHAAGILALEEAGGTVISGHGDAYRPTRTTGHIIAAGSQTLARELAGLDWVAPERRASFQTQVL